MATCGVEAERVDARAAECRRQRARSANVPKSGPKWGIQISEPISTRPAEVPAVSRRESCRRVDSRRV